jgi:hypothetical protein
MLAGLHFSGKKNGPPEGRTEINFSARHGPRDKIFLVWRSLGLTLYLCSIALLML